ncbi:MAG: UpxY family transcription antiterminator [Alphaproteobacteria bacterium]|uniref:UpxY family transcription antiterminator n=1 Tax=Candidatus Nitrobium versatile TaxID=2884831 RepID=A0A953JBQ6_9BACT|nr:UpxY family transcription antiterminator [Candidatus Nitrobium versatile]
MMNWYALHVKSRHEFVTSGELTRKGIDAYLPAVKIMRQWKDRKKLIEAPLFPGYLFVHLHPTPEEFLNVLKTRGVVTFIALNPGSPTPVAKEEIESLKLLTMSGEEIDLHPELKTGTKVRVKKGPLTGAEGLVVKRENQFLFVVTITLLGRSVAVRIYASDMESA